MKILLASANWEWRQTATELFSGAGHQITLCQNGLLAREILESSDFDFNLVISDTGMGKVEWGGGFLAEFCRSRKPDLPFILAVEIAFGPVLFEVQRLGIYLLDRPLFLRDPNGYIDAVQRLVSGEIGGTDVVILPKHLQMA